jgi:hydroxymethylpyrimidine pyrophosphatase-like HAD family hydrolase
MAVSTSGAGIKVVYTDLDGTMVGPRGCFFRDHTGATTLEPAQALIDLLDAGIAVVMVSGRSRAQLMEAAGILGADGFIAELGGIVAWRDDTARFTSQLLPTAGPPAGPELVALLTSTFDLALYEPWAEGHEVDVLLRGWADIGTVDAWLAEQGAPHLRLRDNGLLPRGLGHAWHLIPDGVSKGAAVAWDLRRRGLTSEQAIAVGDSSEDLRMAAHVSRFFLTANALQHPNLPPLATNVVVTQRPLGLGWAEAARAALTGDAD